MLNKFKTDLEGLVLGKYTVIKFSHIAKSMAYWKIKCACGTEKILSRLYIVTRKPQSCGCLAPILREKFITKHGFYSGSQIQKAFINLYDHMIQRCYNPNDKSYSDYGGRGIKICDRWMEPNGKGFLNLVEDKFEEYRIRRENGEIINLDRMDNDDNYSPENTRWATHKKNCQNTRVSSHTLDPEAHKLWRNKIGVQIASVMAKRQKTSYVIDEYVGCSSEEFKRYIESLWTKGMNWDNYGRGPDKWSIDHLNPVNRFDLSIEEDRYRCYNKFNLQPMWWPDNAKLRTKISKALLPA